MDIRDILKSFDSLSEGETTVHKAGPGGYGNKHGSEDVTDQYGKPIGRMSLGKLGAKNEPKRGKGRPPNPDKAQSYDSSALGKAMGIGKAPKPSGKPSVKHSLKEYFDQMDEALSEAGLAVQPMPATPQQQQQKAMAAKPSFMIKDPANPNMPAITTQDPAVVQAAKNGTMSMQKPGAAPGATPAAGAGSQVKPMEEDGENWIKGAIKHPGAFTKKASSHGMTPKEFANKVLAHKKDYPAKTEKQAQLAKTLGKMHHEGEMEEAVKAFSTSDYDRGLSMPNLTRPTDQVGRNKLAATVKQNRQANPGMRGYMSGQSKPQDGEGEARISPNSNVREAEAPQHFAQSSPLSTANRGVLEGGVAKQGFVILDPRLNAQIEPMDATEVEDDVVWSTNPNVTAKLMAFAKANPHRLKISSSMSDTGGARPVGNQWNPAAGPELVEGKKGVNPFAKKDTKKKPDENNNNIPDYAEDGKGKNDLKKKGAAPKKGVNPFAKKTEKKKVKEGKEQHLQAARLEGKSHALRKMPYNCTHDDMEEARCYHDGFKEGLDECYGQMPILGRTRVGEVDEAYVANPSNQYDHYGDEASPEEHKAYQDELNLYKTPGAHPALASIGMGRAQGMNSRLIQTLQKRGKPVQQAFGENEVGTMASYGAHDVMDEGMGDDIVYDQYCSYRDEGKTHEQAVAAIAQRYRDPPQSVEYALKGYPEYAPKTGEMDEGGNAFTAGLAKTPHGGKFKVGGSTFTDRTSYDSKLEELAFEALDKQLNALLESEEKVSEGMTVSISKGQQGSPDSVSVSAQDGEADQLLSIIKSAGMGLFGGDEQNGYGAPQGSAGAHGGISVVDDHDGMMALMKKLSGAGGEMTSGGDYESEEGHEGHGEEGHSHEGEEDTCNECGYMESKCQCDHGDEQVVDEVQSRNQMLYNVAEDNPPDSEEAEHANIANTGAEEDDALAKDDAAQNMATAKTYSSPTNEDEDETGEEAGKEELEEGTCKKCDCKPCKCETVAESFANLYKKLAFLSEESTEKEDEKAEKAGKKVAKDIEYDEGHEGKDDNKAEKAGKKVTKDIEYDDKKDKKKIDEWANEAGKNGTDAAFEADIDFMTKVISGGLNKQKSTGQTTIPVINGQKNRMGVDGLGSPMKESTDLLKDYMKLSGL